MRQEQRSYTRSTTSASSSQCSVTAWTNNIELKIAGTAVQPIAPRIIAAKATVRVKWHFMLTLITYIWKKLDNQQGHS